MNIKIKKINDNTLEMTITNVWELSRSSLTKQRDEIARKITKLELKLDDVNSKIDILDEVK